MVGEGVEDANEPSAVLAVNLSTAVTMVGLGVTALLLPSVPLSGTMVWLLLTLDFIDGLRILTSFFLLR